MVHNQGCAVGVSGTNVCIWLGRRSWVAARRQSVTMVDVRLCCRPRIFPTGLLVADHQGRVITFNRMAARLTGVSADHALGKDFRDVLPLHDPEGRDWWKCTDPYGGLRIRVRQPERRLLLADGREVMVAARYVRNKPCGDVVRLVVTLRDAAPRATSERSSANLVSMVAHELRSPLTSVKGFIATLLAKWASAHRHAEDLHAGDGERRRGSGHPAHH